MDRQAAARVAGVLWLAALAAGAAEPTVELDAPAVLDRPGTTYVLTRDVTAEHTAFTIKGDGITLDLGGHTVTYGTAVGVDRCSGVFLRPAGSEEPFKGVPKEGFGGGNGFTLRNGRIVQGPQPLATKLTMRSGRVVKAEGPTPGRSCFAVYVRGCDGLEITGITTDVNSRDTDNFYIRDCGNVHIHHNQFISTVREIADRHWPGTGVVTVAGVRGPMDIHDNTIDGGGQWGIRVHGDGGLTGHLVQVHHNIIRHRTYTTNGYAIGAAAPNMRVFANVVDPVAGRGVHLTGAGTDFYNNIVLAREKPNPEYPRTRTHGIKLEGCRYTLVHHNFSLGVADPAFGDAAPLDFSVPTRSANRVFKNTIVALRKPDAGKLWAATLDLYSTQPHSLTQVCDNVFRTNHLHVRGDWGGCRGFEFSGNRFERIGEAPDYRFFNFRQSTQAQSRNLVFRDCSLVGGADPKQAAMLYAATPRQGIDVRVEWTVTVRAADPAGKPLSGVLVVALEGDREVASATTGKDGRAPVVLLDYRIVADSKSPVEDHGPYTLVLRRGAQEVQRLAVDPTETTSIAATLADPARKLYVYAGEDQRRKLGETATLEGTVKTIDGQGKPQVTWKLARGPAKLEITNPGSARAQVVMSKWGGYTFELEATLGDEVARDSVSIRADARLTPEAVAEAPATAKLRTIVQLDASKSRDPRGFPKDQIRYAWKQVEGPEAILSSPEWPDPIFYPTQPGTYAFEVTVSNPIRTSKPARCSVQVTE